MKTEAAIINTPGKMQRSIGPRSQVYQGRSEEQNEKEGKRGKEKEEKEKRRVIFCLFIYSTHFC